MMQLPGCTVLVTDSAAMGGMWHCSRDKSQRQLLTGLDGPFGRYKFDPKSLETGAAKRSFR